MKKKSLYLFWQLNSEIFDGRFLAGAVVLLSLTITWGCNAQHPQSQVGKDESAARADTQNATKDTLPKGRIGVKPPPTGRENWLFVFYDTAGKVVKEITDKDMPAYSKFKSLDFPRIREEHGEPIKEEKGGVIKYNLRDLTFTKRKEVLQKAGVAGIPDSVIRRATDITYFGDGVGFPEGGRFIIAKAVSRFYDEAARYPIYTCFDQTHVSIFDSTGNAVRQLDINHFVSDALISDDGRYLLAFVVRGELQTPDLPFLVHDFNLNKIDTIDLREEYHSVHPLYTLYSDSFFQVLLGAGPNHIHLLINPIEKKIYLKSYGAARFELLGNGYRFNSMHLPDGTKINIRDYQIMSY